MTRSGGVSSEVVPDRGFCNQYIKRLSSRYPLCVLWCFCLFPWNMNSVIHLTDKERRNAISKTVISLFAACKNRPSTINDLHELYADMKGGIEVRREGPPKDKTSSIRSYISQWNKMAKSMNLPRHGTHDNGCTQMKPHRVCRKRVPKVGNVYWLNEAFFLNIRNDHELIKPCLRSKRAHRKSHSESSISTAFKTSCNVNKLPQRSFSMSKTEQTRSEWNSVIPANSYPMNPYDWGIVAPQVGLMADFNKWGKLPTHAPKTIPTQECDSDNDSDLDFPKDEEDDLLNFDSLFVNMSQFHMENSNHMYLSPDTTDTYSTCSSPPPDFDTFADDEE